MNDLDRIVNQPIFFKKNRVYRIYTGGLGFDKVCKDGSTDCTFPEEWLASKVRAINPKYFTPRDGVSIVEGTNVYFDDLLAMRPQETTGGKKYDCLVKYLDSAVRLPMQVHPTKAFSKQYFASEYGKTEAWLVIATRPNAKIYFGFSRNVTKNELSDLVERSIEEPDVMESILNGVEAKVGDTYLIRGGMIHAIGAGCTIIEVQEPTDFTIQPENWCAGYRISDKEKYIGLTKSQALDCFDYTMVGTTALEAARITPRKVVDTPTYVKEEVVSYSDTTCFAENRHTLSNGKIVLNGAPSVWIVLDGGGEIEGDGYLRKVKGGDYFFLPYAANGKFSFVGSATLVECLPSKQV